MTYLYCERTGPGLWAEPANVASNLAFVLAAWAIWRLRKDSGIDRASAALFAGLTLSIAAGSALFHMLATPSARLLDEGPIVLFQVVFLWRYGRGVMGWRSGSVALAIAMLVATSAAARLFATGVNGSLPYFPALALTALLGIDHLLAHRRRPWSLLAGSLTFGAAVFLRSIDRAVCASFPTGTHFLWHALAAVVLYLFASGLLDNTGGMRGAQVGT